MRILVINQFASTPEYSTGAGERHFYLAKYLAGHIKFDILSGSFNHLFYKLPDTKGLITKEEIKGGAFYWVRMRKYKGERLIERVFSWIEFLLKIFFYPIKDENKPDIILVSSMSILPVFYAYYLKRKFKIPFILEIRDIWPLTPIQLGGHSKYHPLILFLSFIERFGYKYSDSIISVLPSFDNYLKGNFRLIKKVWWIPNAIDVEIAEKLGLYNKLLEDDKKFKVAYVGSLGTANAMDVFVDAAIMLKDNSQIQWIAVGNGPEKYKLEEKAKDLSNITFISKISKSEVHSVLANVDVCFISWQNLSIYNYGVSANKYNDYMLAKKPIISASNIPDDPVVLANCGERVACGDSVAIVKTVLDFYKMPTEHLHAVGLNGFKYLIENNTYDIISRKYFDCIQQTLTDFQKNLSEN